MLKLPTSLLLGACLLHPQLSTAKTLDWDFDVILAVEKPAAFNSLSGQAPGWNTELRRAQAELTWETAQSWELEISGDYQTRDDEAEFEWKDISVTWQRDNAVGLKIGQFLEPFGLERTTGYTRLSVTERSMATDIFAPGRSLGLSLFNQADWGTWAFGLFQEGREKDDPRGASGRVTHGFKPGGEWQAQIGLSASHKLSRDSRLRVRNRAELYSGETVIRSPGYDFDRASTLGLEALGVYQSWTFSGEWFARQIRLETSDRVWQQGGYLQSSYLFNGERRRYRDNRLVRFKPQAGWGALEAVFRYSGVDLEEDGIGQKADIFLVGLNYYWKKRFQVRGNLLFPQVSGQTEQTDPSGNAFSLRFISRF